MTSIVKTAWAYSPTLAVHLVARFNSQKLAADVRWQILNFPEKVLHEPGALEMLLGPALPNDVSFQLKVRSHSIPSVYD